MSTKLDRLGHMQDTLDKFTAATYSATDAVDGDAVLNPGTYDHLAAMQNTLKDLTITISQQLSKGTK
jgi:hypothetical protein